jgi:hypothetical protein
MAGNSHPIYYGPETEELGPLSAHSAIRAQQLAIRHYPEVPILPSDGI